LLRLADGCKRETLYNVSDRETSIVAIQRRRRSPFQLDNVEGLFTQKNPRTLPEKSEKSEKNLKNLKKSKNSLKNPKIPKIHLKNPEIHLKNPEIHLKIK
jgi:hypothetical protein